jgi:aromatic-L-amino-acid decarboxylase
LGTPHGRSDRATDVLFQPRRVAPQAGRHGCRFSVRGAPQKRIREDVRLAGRPFSVVCFRRSGSDADNERLLERVNASGEIFRSHTRLGDRYVLRLAVGSFRTTEEDVRLAWEVLRREAAALIPAEP